VLTKAYNIACLHLENNHFQEALIKFESLYETRKATLGPRHPHTLSLLRRKADCLFGLKRFEEAKPFYETCAEIYQSMFGDAHIRTERIRAKLNAINEFMLSADSNPTNVAMQVNGYSMISHGAVHGLNSPVHLVNAMQESIKDEEMIQTILEGSTGRPKFTKEEQRDWRQRKLVALKLENASLQVTNTVLGQGGFGKVFIGYWRNHEVAVKCIPLNDNGLFPEVENEMLLMKYLGNHPTILAFYGYTITDSWINAVLEIAPFGALSQVLYNHDTMLFQPSLSLLLYPGCATCQMH
jgi:tetratricopeptide (TPR) repeat protein